jgi:hypothetical protein
VKALLFSPYALISRHTNVEMDLLNYLIHESCSIDVIQCNGLLDDFCIAMASMGLDHTSSNLNKKLVCQACKIARNTIQNKPSEAKYHTIDQWKIHVNSELINFQLTSITQDNWMLHEFEGIQIGRLAAVDLLMHYKINSNHLPDYLWNGYINQLRICYETYFCSLAFLNDLRPDRVFMYNTLFGVNRVVQQVSERLEIPCYSIHLGFQSKSDSNALMMYRDDDEQLRIAHTQEAKTSISKPISPDKVDKAFQFFDVTLNALSHTVYSKAYSKVNPAQTRQKFNIQENRPVLFIPLASADERFALKLLDLQSLSKPAELFGHQNEWISFILGLARDHQEWDFIFRPHPRMFPNHRDRNTASGAFELLDLLSNATSNVHINLPSDNVSLPEILQITDVVLGGTSSAGLEALAYGIPVVTHNEDLLFAYPAQIGEFARSEIDYVDKIKSSIKHNWNVENTLKALRWMSFLDNTVSLSITYTNQPNQNSSLFQSSNNWQIRFLRHFKVFQRLPKVLALVLGGILQIRRTRKWMDRELKFTDDASTFMRIFTEKLPGLHSSAEKTTQNSTEELKAVRANYEDVLTMLGRFDDPNCLSSRIERFLY